MEQILSDLIFALWDEIIKMFRWQFSITLVMFFITWLFQAVILAAVMSSRGE